MLWAFIRKARRKRLSKPDLGLRSVTGSNVVGTGSGVDCVVRFDLDRDEESSSAERERMALGGDDMTGVLTDRGSVGSRFRWGRLGY